jgi:hypothetical protein
MIKLRLGMRRSLGGQDPYEILKSDWSHKMYDYHALMFPGIMCYLVYSTFEDVRAYKRLEA